MILPSFKPSRTRWLLFLSLVTGFTLYFAIFGSPRHSPISTLYRMREGYTHPDQAQLTSNLNSGVTQDTSNPQAIKKLPKSRYAVATFLGTELDAKDDTEDDEHLYFVGARTLVYQLLHAERTKFRNPISVVILVTKGVRESKRQRLRDDGAIIVEVADMEHLVEIEVPRYAEVFNKLRVFDPNIMPFEKVALLDTDMVITRPIDSIFDDPASKRFLVNRNATALDPDLPPLPDSYVLASTPDIASRPYGFPPNLTAEDNRDYFNAGVIVLSPSTELFNLYLAVLRRTDLFDGFWPEQNLLNYVHKRDGPMPWGGLDLLWHLILPSAADFEAGMAILHCKFWDAILDPCHQSALSRRWEMQGYWSGREQR